MTSLIQTAAHKIASLTVVFTRLSNFQTSILNKQDQKSNENLLCVYSQFHPFLWIGPVSYTHLTLPTMAVV